jgi:prophage antirepressor-like protein
MSDSNTPRSERQLTTFDYQAHPIRTFLDENNEIFFVAIDICKALDFKNPPKAITDHVDEEDRGYATIIDGKVMGGITKRYAPTDGLNTLHVINEPGLYSLVLTSRKAEAKKFKHWVTHDVLPSIRKTGSYSKPYDTNDSDSILNWMQSQLDQWRQQSKQLASLERGFGNLDMRLTSLERGLVTYESRLGNIEQRQDLLERRLSIQSLAELKTWITAILDAGDIQYQTNVAVETGTIPVLTDTDIFTFREHLTSNILKSAISELNVYLKALAVTRVLWVIAITADEDITRLEREASRYGARLKIARLTEENHH